MRKILSAVALTTVLSGASLAQAHKPDTQPEPEHVWVFGDSLSDTGNLSLLFAADTNDDTYLPQAYAPYQPFPEPQYEGTPLADLWLQRVSNGQTTVEYVAKHYAGDDYKLLPSFLHDQLSPMLGDRALNNFAVFGALAAGESPLDLRYQVAGLVQRVNGGVDVSEDRAIVAIGSNDLFLAWETAIAPLATGGEIDLEAGKAVLDEAIASYETFVFADGVTEILSPAGDGSTIEIPSLAGLGITKFTVFNSPDIAVTPVVTQAAAAFGPARDDVVDTAAELTAYFNEELYWLAAREGRPLRCSAEEDELDVVIVDLLGAIGEVMDTEGDALNMTEDCFRTNTLATLTDGVPPTPGVYREGCSAEASDGYMFLDTAHPTGAFHAKVGAEVTERLEKAPKLGRPWWPFWWLGLGPAWGPFGVNYY